VLEPDRVRLLVRGRVLLEHGLATTAARELIARLPAPENRSFSEWAALYQVLHSVRLHESAPGAAASAYLEPRRKSGDPVFWSTFPDATRDGVEKPK
jgi:hypothetical protein